MNYTDILQQLISIDTTVPPGLNYEKAIDLVQPLFEEHTFETEKVGIPQEHTDYQFTQNRGLAETLEEIAPQFSCQQDYHQFKQDV